MEALLGRNRLTVDPPELGTGLYLPGLPGGGNKIHDRSPYGNHGTITGATWKRLPGGLWYLDFDGGDDYVDCGYPASLRMGSGNFTASIWFKANQVDDWIALMHCGGASAGGERFALYIPPSSSNANELQFQLDDDANPVNVQVSFSDWGEWHKFTCVRDGNVARTYIDDQIKETGDSSALGSIDSPNNRSLTLGCNTAEGDGSHAAYLAGSLALAILFKGLVLSPLQIQNSFNQEKHLFGVW